MVVPLSDRSNKKRSENDRWPQLAASANNISLDSGKGVFICERVVDHHTPFLYFFYSPKCSELLGNSDFAKSITFGCFVPVFSVGMFRKKSISSLLEPRLEQVAQMLHYLCIVFVVVHALNRQGPIVCIAAPGNPQCFYSFSAFIRICVQVLHHELVREEHEAHNIPPTT